MRNWEGYVRQRLRLEGMTLEREKTIVREVATQLEEFYREGLSQGMTEVEADEHARRQVRDWSCFESDIRRADPRNARSRIDQWHEIAEAKTPQKGGLRTMLSDIPKDVLYGLRILRRNPGFTVVAVLTLALGIGANTAIFSVVNGVLLQPLPYGEPDQIVRVFETTRGRSGRGVASPANFLDWKDKNEVFEHIAAIRFRSFILTGASEPAQLTAASVSPELFPLMGMNPLAGRTFLAEDAVPGREKIVVLGYALWQGRFGGDPSIPGQPITLNGEPYTVVGVMPASFQHPSYAQFWLPLAFTPKDRERRSSFFLRVIARLKSGTSLEQAQAGMDTLAQQLEEEYPETNENRGVNLVPLHTDAVRDVRSNLWLLLGAVGFVLLIACSNVANLLLARASSREKEVAIRAAIGAGRYRLIRQLLTESILLGSLGGAVGLLLAWGGVKTFIAFSPPNFPRLEAVGVNLHVLAYTLGLSFLTGIIFGVAPAMQSSRLDLNEALKEGTRRGGSGFSLLQRHRLRNLLVIGEISLALVLLVGGGLLIRSFALLIGEASGFQAEKLLAMDISLPGYKYPEATQQRAFFEQLVERSKNVSGAIRVAAANALPFSDMMLTLGFRLEAAREGGEDVCRSADYKLVTEGYFRTLGIPVIQGRGFTAQDTDKDAPAMIVNQAFVREFSPQADILDRRIIVGARPIKWSTIVGVVGDVKHISLDRDPQPTLYRPFAQAPEGSMMLVVRTPDEPASVVTALRSQVQILDPDQPIFRISTMNGWISDSVAQPRFYMLLLALFAGIAGLLAAVGIYGVMAYSVSQRTHEIGIRMAMGAQQNDVLKLVLLQGGILTGIGVVVGLGGAYALTRYMKSLLYEITPTDPATFAGIALLLAAASMLACFIPARRATKVDPMVALRYE